MTKPSSTSRSNTLNRDELPVFDNPPIVETVLSVQFQRLAAIQSVHLGSFWQRVRDRFPKTEDHSPLPLVVEQAVPTPASFQFRLETEPLSPRRLWLVNDSRTEMIQIQSDRFVKNWRKNNDSELYPRYEAVIKPAFERDYQIFCNFLREESLGEIVLNQCEVTYVNHIISGEGWESWSEAGKIFSFWTQSQNMANQLEDLSLQARFPILGANKEWLGRLYLDIQPALRTSDGKPMYVMQLTARGMLGAGLEFLDIGRQSVVKSFDQFTTPHMHKIWQKR